MASTITIGLSEIEIGDIAGDGGMGTSLAALGYTEQDSTTFTVEEPTDTEFIPEEIDDPIHVESAPGAKTLTFTVMDPDVTTFEEIFGGTVVTTGSSPNEIHTWNAPATQISVEKSIRVTPRQGLTLEITRAKISPSMSSVYTKNGLFTVTITAKVLKPTKVAESAYRLIKED